MRTCRIVALVLVAGALTAGPARAVGETCRGQAATIVGTPGGTATGTDGDDVIVTNGADTTQGGDGDDTICVTATNRWDIPTVDAGPGDDTVDTSATRADSLVTLGAGADHLFGGRGGENVLAGSSRDDDAEADVVRTRGGYDTVVSGQPDQPDPDDVDLGAGGGAIDVRSLRPTGVLRAAPGSPSTLRVDTFTAGRWVVDQRAEQVTLDGQLAFGWENLAIEYVDAVPTARVRYRGDDGANDLTLFGGIADGIFLGGGPDTAYFARAVDLRGTVSGADGRDTITIVGDRVVADLRAGTFGVDGADGRLRGVENLTITGALSATVHGTAGRNHLDSDACTSHVRAGEGDDTVYNTTSRGPRSPCRDRDVDVEVYGGPGDDDLNGGSVNDHLFGGAGDDSASGHRGHDLCRAEHVISCEA